MNVFDLITQEEMDDAPEDDALAFTQLVSIAQRRLSEFVNQFHDDDQGSYAAIEEARHGFMNVVVGLARAYRIEPFASMDVPRYEQFDLNVHRQFKADLDHYITQLLVSNSIKGRQDSTLIPPKVKDRLRAYIHGLKTEIDKADLSDTKRASLHSKLAEFEVELEKKRLSLIAVARITMYVLGIPTTVWGSYEVVAKLTHNVLEVVAEAKATEEQDRQLPASPSPVALIPPRKNDTELTSKKRSSGSFASDLDDEIPF